MVEKNKFRKVKFIENGKTSFIKVPTDQSKEVPMKWAENSKFARDYSKKNAVFADVVKSEITRRHEYSGAPGWETIPITLIDSHGKQTTYYQPHAGAISVKTVIKDGKEYIKKTYGSQHKELVFPKQYKELVNNGAPLPKMIDIKFKFNTFSFLEEKHGESIYLMKEVTQAEAADIMKELRIAIDKFKKLDYFPRQCHTSHTLYDKTKPPGDSIMFIKPTCLCNFSKEPDAFGILGEDLAKGLENSVALTLKYKVKE